MITVHIEAKSAAELRGDLESLLSVVAGGAAPVATEAPKRAAAPKAAPKEMLGAADGAVVSAAGAAVTGNVPSVGDYIAKLARHKDIGKEKTLTLLGKFGAKRGQELKAEDHAKFIAEAKALLGE
jgi:hypothetical protein